MKPNLIFIAKPKYVIPETAQDYVNKEKAFFEYFDQTLSKI